MAIGQLITFATVRDNIQFSPTHLGNYVNSRINASSTEVSYSGGQIRTSYVPGAPGFSAGNPIEDQAIRNYVSALANTFAVVRTFRFSAVGCGTSYTRRSVWVNLGNTSAVSPNNTSFPGSDGAVIRDSHFNTANGSLVTTILNNEGKLDATFNYCHCSCHGSCHGSRGRR